MPFVEYRSKNFLKFFLHRCFEVKCSSDANAFPPGKLSKSQPFTGHRKIQFALLLGQNGKKLLLFEGGDQFLHAVAGVCQPCSGLHIVLRHKMCIRDRVGILLIVGFLGKDVFLFIENAFCEVLIEPSTLLGDTAEFQIQACDERILLDRKSVV